MAELVIRKMVDDLDQSEDGVATTPFAFEGVEYEIDLSQGNYVKLRGYLDDYLKAARRVGGRATPRKVSIPGATTVESRSNGNGHVTDTTTTRLTLNRLDGAKKLNQAIRDWYDQQPASVQQRIGVLHPRGAIRESIKRAYQESQAEDAATGLRAAVAGYREQVDESELIEAEMDSDGLMRDGQNRLPAVVETVRTEIPPSGTTENAMIRAWYRDQPYPWRAEHPLKEMGKVPASIREAWKNRDR